MISHIFFPSAFQTLRSALKFSVGTSLYPLTIMYCFIIRIKSLCTLYKVRTFTQR